MAGAVEADLDHALDLRRRIHSSPNLGGQEQATAEVIEAELSPFMSLDTIAGTGRIGRIGPADGPAVGIRAELDALPGEEATGADFASTNGAMHACGHDVHMAALVAVIRAIPELGERTGQGAPTALAAVFQPREESYPSGALDIVSEKGLEKASIARMIGVHNHPGVPLGQVAIGEGYINAAADEVHITVHGRGGHGAYPHNASDPVAAVANVALSVARDRPQDYRADVGGSGQCRDDECRGWCGKRVAPPRKYPRHCEDHLGAGTQGHSGGDRDHGQADRAGLRS
ncbi:amidohydrolase [Brevibacterium casei]|nr:amidohydrolase [Brevibacterium casei]